MFILALKSPKKHIFRSKFWSHQRQKCYRNLFLCHFETPKEYGRHLHRYLGKVKFFWDQLDHKNVPKTEFFLRGGFWKMNNLCRRFKNAFLLFCVKLTWHTISFSDPRSPFHSPVFTKTLLAGAYTNIWLSHTRQIFNKHKIYYRSHFLPFSYLLQHNVYIHTLKLIEKFL